MVMVQFETIFAILKISEIELYLGIVIEKPYVKSQAQTFLARNPKPATRKIWYTINARLYAVLLLQFQFDAKMTSLFILAMNQDMDKNSAGNGISNYIRTV